MNKSELIDAIAGQSGLSKADSGRALEAVTEVIVKAVASGDSVALVGFGTFEAKERAAREGRNPATGEALKIPAKRVPGFKAGAKFREAVEAKAKPKGGKKK